MLWPWPAEGRAWPAAPLKFPPEACGKGPVQGRGARVCPPGGRELSRFSASRSPWPRSRVRGQGLVVTSDVAQKRPVSLVLNKAVFICLFFPLLNGAWSPGLGPQAQPALGEVAAEEDGAAHADDEVDVQERAHQGLLLQGHQDGGVLARGLRWARALHPAEPQDGCHHAASPRAPSSCRGPQSGSRDGPCPQRREARGRGPRASRAGRGVRRVSPGRGVTPLCWEVGIWARHFQVPLPTEPGGEGTGLGEPLCVSAMSPRPSPPT